MPEGTRPKPGSDNTPWWDRWFHGVNRSRDDARNMAKVRKAILVIIPITIVIVAAVLIGKKIKDKK